MRNDESRSNIFNLKIQKRCYKSAQKFQIWNILHLGFCIRDAQLVNLPESADLWNQHFRQVQFLNKHEIFICFEDCNVPWPP